MMEMTPLTAGHVGTVATFGGIQLSSRSRRHHLATEEELHQLFGSKVLFDARIRQLSYPWG